MGIHSPTELPASMSSFSDSETETRYSDSHTNPHRVPTGTPNNSGQGFNTVENIFNCMEIVLSYTGINKNPGYGGGTASSIAALNCARLILGMQWAGLRDEQLLKEIKE